MAEGRNLPRERVSAAAKGRVWTGADAREQGLVDELGGYAATLGAVREIAGIAPDTALRLRLFPRRKSTLRLLAEQLSDEGDGEIAIPTPDLLGGVLDRSGPLAALARATGLASRRGLLEMALPSQLRY